MDFGDFLRVTLVVMGVLVVLVLAAIGFAMWRYRIPPRGLVAMFAALGYLLFPVDVVPEALLGPLGLVDDAGVLTLVAIWVWRLTKVRNRLVEGGVIGPDGRLGHRRRPRDTDQV